MFVVRLLIAAAATAVMLPVSALADPSVPKPLKILLLTGGCCHSYATQKDILKKGIEARINATVDQIHVDEGGTEPPLPIYGDADYAKGYDLVIHDECAADVSDPKVIRGVMQPHVDGIPAVALHCAMHSYRQADFARPIGKTGEPRTMWFELLGLQSTAHGAQKPIEVRFNAATRSPITLGMKDWITGNEELYNNITVLPTATSLATGRQGGAEAMVVWTNLYGARKVRVFGTTLGHNDATVSDARYLDLVARGVLWATGKLDETGGPVAGYGRGD